jgi:hypothetical protein
MRRESGDQALATLGPTRVQYEPTTAGLHARTKAVRAGVLEFAGLKSAFHGEA